jgi:hypothetical protein
LRVLVELQRLWQRESGAAAYMVVQGYSLSCDAAVYDTPPLLLSSYAQQPQLNTSCSSYSTAVRAHCSNIYRFSHLYSI